MFDSNFSSGFSFDASKFQPLNSAVPEGEYLMTVTDAEITPTKDGAGAYIKFKWQINGGQHDGRIVFQNVTIRNANETAVNIGMSTLSSMCGAFGIPGVRSEKEFVGRQSMNKVTIRKQEGYSDQNNIVAYRPANAAVGAPMGGIGAFGQPAAQPAAQTNVVNHQQQAAPAQPVQQPQTAPWQQGAAQPVQQPQTAPWQQGAAQPWSQPEPAQVAPQAPLQPQQPAVPASSTPAFGAVPPWMQQQ